MSAVSSLPELWRTVNLVPQSRSWSPNVSRHCFIAFYVLSGGSWIIKIMFSKTRSVSNAILKTPWVSQLLLLLLSVVLRLVAVGRGKLIWQKWFVQLVWKLCIPVFPGVVLECFMLTLIVVVIRESISRQQFDAALNVTTRIIWYWLMGWLPAHPGLHWL